MSYLVQRIAPPGRDKLSKVEERLACQRTQVFLYKPGTAEQTSLEYREHRLYKFGTEAMNEKPHRNIFRIVNFVLLAMLLLSLAVRWALPSAEQTARQHLIATAGYEDEMLNLKDFHYSFGPGGSYGPGRPGFSLARQELTFSVEGKPDAQVALYRRAWFLPWMVTQTGEAD